MPRKSVFLLSSGLVAVGGGWCIPALAQAPIASLNQADDIVIEGRVTDIFGNKFVLADDSGRILVETGPHWFTRIDVRPGERLRVIGRAEGAGFDAFRIVREDGREIHIRPSSGPPPWAGGGRN